jgi:hypothetical protein
LISLGIKDPAINSEATLVLDFPVFLTLGSKYEITAGNLDFQAFFLPSRASILNLMHS